MKMSLFYEAELLYFFMKVFLELAGNTFLRFPNLHGAVVEHVTDLFGDAVEDARKNIETLMEAEEVIYTNDKLFRKALEDTSTTKASDEEQGRDQSNVEILESYEFDFIIYFCRRGKFGV